MAEAPTASYGNIVDRQSATMNRTTITQLRHLQRRLNNTHLNRSGNKSSLLVECLRKLHSSLMDGESGLSPPTLDQGLMTAIEFILADEDVDVNHAIVCLERNTRRGPHISAPMAEIVLYLWCRFDRRLDLSRLVNLFLARTDFDVNILCTKYMAHCWFVDQAFTHDLDYGTRTRQGMVYKILTHPRFDINHKTYKSTLRVHSMYETAIRYLHEPAVECLLNLDKVHPSVIKARLPHYTCSQFQLNAIDLVLIQDRYLNNYVHDAGKEFWSQTRQNILLRLFDYGVPLLTRPTIEWCAPLVKVILKSSMTDIQQFDCSIHE